MISLSAALENAATRKIIDLDNLEYRVHWLTKKAT